MKRVALLVTSLSMALWAMVPVGAHNQKESDPKGDMEVKSLDLVKLQAKETKKNLQFKVKINSKAKKGDFQPSSDEDHNIIVFFHEQQSDPEVHPYLYNASAVGNSIVTDSGLHEFNMKFKKKKGMLIFKIKRAWLNDDEANDLMKGDTMEWWVESFASNWNNEGPCPAGTGGCHDRAPDDTLEETPKYAHELKK